MKLAILFWCYKNPELCLDRLRLIRRCNKQTPIFVLYGGKPQDAPLFEELFHGIVDDFYQYNEPPPVSSEELLAEFRNGVRWKYLYGDLQFVAWFRNRGIALDWDTVVVIQWDMLVFCSVTEAFSSLKKNEILFSGLRPVSEVEDRWSWVSPDQPAARKMYLDFLMHVKNKYGFTDAPQCFIAIVLAMPRSFLKKFAQIEARSLGFLEYRLPVYAQIFGTPICTEHAFKPWWGAVETYSVTSTLRALPFEIWVPTILINLIKKRGARIFHPFWRPVPAGIFGWSCAFLRGLQRAVVAIIRGLPVC